MFITKIVVERTTFFLAVNNKAEAGIHFPIVNFEPKIIVNYDIKMNFIGTYFRIHLQNLILNFFFFFTFFLKNQQWLK